MKYYRIKQEYDNARLLNRAKRTFDGILIGNELYTVKAWERLVLKYRVSEAVCDIVNISSNIISEQERVKCTLRTYIPPQPPTKTL